MKRMLCDQCCEIIEEGAARDYETESGVRIFVRGDYDVNCFIKVAEEALRTLRVAAADGRVSMDGTGRIHISSEEEAEGIVAELLKLNGKNLRSVIEHAA